MPDAKPAHSMRPTDLWFDPTPSYCPSREDGYFCVVALLGPTVVRGWWICGEKPPRLVELCGDIFEKHARRVDTKRQASAPTGQP